MKRTLLLAWLAIATMTAASQTLQLSEINVRDPYILADKKTHRYYLYASSNARGSNGQTLGGMKVYSSKDLKTWTDEGQAFTCPEDNWITGRLWAPEVHLYKGRYYLFATLNSDVVWKRNAPGHPAYTMRGTQVFWAKQPTGPFKAFDRLPFTPIDQMALDGTLWVEERRPYLVYCHEWVELGDGTVEYRSLKKDLSAPDGPPTRLFCASAAEWSNAEWGQVTDGCFLYRTKTGKLLMTWSSFFNGSYAIGIAESTSGHVYGPWRQQATPLFTADGGHSMIFTTFDGRLCITFHTPNNPGGMERAVIYELEDLGHTLRIKNKISE